MEHTNESQLPRPYVTASEHPEADRQIRRPSLLNRFKRRPFLVWVGVVITLTLVGGALYSVYMSAVQGNVSVVINGRAQTSPPTTTPGSKEVGHGYGIAAGGSLAELNDQELEQRMAGIEAAGATWVRFDFSWDAIQPDDAAHYSWATYDRLAASAQKHHLLVLGILDFTPRWARSAACVDSDKCQPADNQQFANFARTVVHRYKDKGLHYWEIWNEPNNPQFWQPRSNPTAYAHLLQAAAVTMRAEDAQAYLITAGLSPQDTTDTSYSPIAFLTAVYAAGVKDSFDAVADHPYTFPLSPKDPGNHAWSQMVSAKSSLRQTMAGNGDTHKKLWITEFGAPTGGPGPVATISNPNLAAHPYVVDEPLQAKILSDAFALYKSYDWAGPFMYYSYQDAGTSPDTNENFFGLLRADGSKKPAYQVFADTAKAAAQ